MLYETIGIESFEMENESMCGIVGYIGKKEAKPITSLFNASIDFL